MNKTLRIFAKDMRHLWPEVSLGVLIAFAYAAIEPWDWPSYRQSLPSQSGVLLALVNLLLPLSWALLIARSVHDEPLVGDRQFWLTRPYSWQRVLSAKLLFLLVAVMLPTFCAKLWLLHLAGLSISANLAPLLLNMLLTLLVVLLPIMALAAVTANLTRMFLTGLGLLLALVFTAYIASLVLRRHDTYGPGSPSAGILAVWFVAATLAAILLQYARRQTGTSRVILVLTLAGIVIVSVLYLRTWTPSRTYPELAAGEAVPFTLDLRPQQQDLEQAASLDREQPATAESAYLPVLFDNIPAGRAVQIDHLDASIEAAGGRPSRLEPSGGVQSPVVNGDAPLVYLGLLPLSGQQKSSPVTLHLTMAITELEQSGSAAVTPAAPSFSVPGNGVCAATAAGDSLLVGSCAYAFNRQPLSRVQTEVPNEPCSRPAHASSPQTEWMGHAEGNGSSLALDPVQNGRFSFQREHRGALTGVKLCPSTPVVFQQFRVVRHRLVHVTLSGVVPAHALLFRPVNWSD